MAKLENLIQAKDVQPERMNMLVKHGYEAMSSPSLRLATRMEDILTKRMGLDIIREKR
jgi:hypothetical protein